MSFDRFLLTVEPGDLSQADKSITRTFSFPKLSDGKQKSFFCFKNSGFKKCLRKYLDQKLKFDCKKKHNLSFKQ